MPSGLLRVDGTFDIGQFWPTGTSDADTVVTHAFEGAKSKGQGMKTVIEKGKITESPAPIAKPPAPSGARTLQQGRDQGAVEELRRRGVVFDHGPRDQDWLWREARLHDPDGNELCLHCAGENSRFPPWRIGGDAHP